jgi:DNA-binding SARP family transcriptional activator
VLFGVLGPLSVRRPDGRTLEMTAERQRRLLALLLLHGNDWVSLEDAVAVLWPDGAPETAETNIRTYVHHLRQSLPRTQGGTPRINGRAGAHRLNLAITETDAGLFEDMVTQGRAALGAGDASAAVERLTSALALWRGEPFDPLDPELTRDRTAELEDLRWQARDALADALLSADRPTDAVSLLWPLSDQAPLREDTWRRLIAALDRDGHRDQALAVYEQFRAAQTDAGVEAGPALLRLHRQLLGQDDGQTIRIRPGEAGLPADRHVPPLDDLRLDPRPRPAEDADPAAWADPGTRGRRRGLLPTAVLVLVALVAAGGIYWYTQEPASQAPAADASPTATRPSTPETTGTPLPDGVSPRRAVPGRPNGGSPTLLFGVGDQADVALGAGLAQSGGARLLTTRFTHDPAAVDEVTRLATWRNSVVPQAYGSGFGLHLVLADGSKETQVATPSGQACGRPYALSPEFLADVELLATAFAGQADGPPLFVTLFDGVQGYACVQSSYRPDAPTQAYYEALIEQYRKAREAFLRIAPNALVSLGWHSGIAGYDDPKVGGGVSMIREFSQVIGWSDFVSASATEPDGNVDDVRAAVTELGRYAPVLLSYGPSAAFDQDVPAILTDGFLAETVRGGLFAITFAGDAVTRAAAVPVADAVSRYGRPAR